MLTRSSPLSGTLTGMVDVTSLGSDLHVGAAPTSIVPASIAVLRRRLAPHGPILAVLSLSGLLNGWALANVGWGNAYYSAAVRSMMQSWHNFVFASFEPGGFVSVDKPPLSLWVQTISAKVFGFNQMALLVPQAIAGVLSVWFVYRAVTLVSSRTAGVVAALFLAVTPVHVMVSHSNNLDAILVCVMSGAAYAAVRAVTSGRLRWLALASGVAGLAMTAKMLAGVPVMPGIALAFVWCAPVAWRRRVTGALMSVVIMAVVGLAWFAYVDLTPKSSRPYVGSSATNSAFQLAFERNGANQVEGTQGGFGGAGGAGRPGGRNFPGGFPRGGLPGVAAGPNGGGVGDGALGGLLPGVPLPGAGAGDGALGGLLPGVTAGPNGVGAGDGALGGLLPGLTLPGGAAGDGAPAPGGPGNGGFGGLGGAPRGGPGGGFGIPRLGFSGGEPGPLRLANTELGSQIAWFLPLSLAGGVLVLARRRFRPSPATAATVIFGGWLLIAGGAFSITKGIVHPYYLSSVAPPAAALAGLGLAEVAAVLRERRWPWLAIPALGLAVTAATQWTVLRRADSVDWRPELAWIAVLGAVVGTIALIAGTLRRSKVAAGAGIAAIGLIVSSPLLWTQSSLANGVTPQIPYAQATGLNGGRSGLQPNGGFTFPTGDQKRLVEYLRSQRTAEEWLVAVQSAGQAESIIISSGEPVMTIGGFSGSDAILTEQQLRDKIDDGQVRFFLVSAGGLGRGGFGPGGGFGRGGIASSFVSTECSEVPATTWQSGSGTAGETSFAGGPTSASFTLYDCKAP